MLYSPLLPPDALGHAPRITLLGSAQALIEQHRGLYSYNNEKIRIRTAQGVLCIAGQELIISHFGEQDLLVRGCIRAVSWGMSE